MKTRSALRVVPQAVSEELYVLLTPGEVDLLRLGFRSLASLAYDVGEDKLGDDYSALGDRLEAGITSTAA